MDPETNELPPTKPRHQLSQPMLALIALVVLALMVLMAGQAFKPQLDNPKFIAVEAPLNKTIKLAISPGEIYTYKYDVWNESANLTYMVIGGKGCTLVRLSGQGASVCLNSEGNDGTMQNSSYAVPAILLTRPWMLAVHENWHWNVSNYIQFDSLSKRIADTSYTTLRKELYRGREAYVVRVESSESGVAIEWIDAEKRVLLKEVGSEYEIVLVSGLQFSD